MSSADMEKKINVSRLYDYYGVLLSERQREIFGLYYMDDFSLGEIADLVGITRQGVLDAIKKSELLLLSYESKLKFAGQFDVIAEAAEHLIEKLGNCECSPDVAVLTEKLKNAIQSVLL